MRPHQPIILLLSIGSLLISCNQQEEDSRYFSLPEGDLEVVQSESQSFIVDTLLTDLTRPWSFEFLPKGLVLITEREGNILIVNGRHEPLDTLQGNIPEGLRDIQLHPKYDENGWIYFSYYKDPTEESDGYAELMQGKLVDNKLEEEELLYSAGPFRLGGGYTGSRIAFDNEGYLYFLVGIRGDRMNAQDKSLHSGKTMRLNDDGSIPVDNPFVNDPDALPEIYSYGHREHQGLVLHPETGEIISTEHGEKGGDELNIIKPGLNYGWPLATWSKEYNGDTISEDPLLEGTEPPLHHWTPAITPSGIDVMVGDRYPGWKGNMFIGSLIPQSLHRSVMDEGEIIHNEKLLEGIGRVRSVKIAPDNYLYFITEDTGFLIRLIPVES